MLAQKLCLMFLFDGKLRILVYFWGMNIELEYLNDRKGKVRAVQIPIADWEKILKKVKKYEQTLKLKSDLEEALNEVALLKKSKGPKQTLTGFLDEI